jgi:hypothetical protein
MRCFKSPTTKRTHGYNGVEPIYARLKACRSTIELCTDKAKLHYAKVIRNPAAKINEPQGNWEKNLPPQFHQLIHSDIEGALHVYQTNKNVKK